MTPTRRSGTATRRPLWSAGSPPAAGCGCRAARQRRTWGTPSRGSARPWAARPTPAAWAPLSPGPCPRCTPRSSSAAPDRRTPAAPSRSCARRPPGRPRSAPARRSPGPAGAPGPARRWRSRPGSAPTGHRPPSSRTTAPGRARRRPRPGPRPRGGPGGAPAPGSRDPVGDPATERWSRCPPPVSRYRPATSRPSPAKTSSTATGNHPPRCQLTVTFTAGSDVPSVDAISTDCRSGPGRQARERVPPPTLESRQMSEPCTRGRLAVPACVPTTNPCRACTPRTTVRGEPPVRSVTSPDRARPRNSAPPSRRCAVTVTSGPTAPTTPEVSSTAGAEGSRVRDAL